MELQCARVVVGELGWQQSDGMAAWENLVRHKRSRGGQLKPGFEGIVGASAAQEALQDDGMGYLRWAGLKGQQLEVLWTWGIREDCGQPQDR